MLVLIMGVSGSGKSSVGTRLAERLKCRFVEADDFHSIHNREKLAAGVALTDEERAPWLDALHVEVAEALYEDTLMVLACSALKQQYRERLVRGGAVMTVLLHGSPQLIASRLKKREGHFMNPSLLENQLQTLEAPGDALVMDVSESADVIAARVEVAVRAELAGSNNECP
jgi:gluconokinase